MFSISEIFIGCELHTYQGRSRQFSIKWIVQLKLKKSRNASGFISIHESSF
jgi:hypothetical protein